MLRIFRYRIIKCPLFTRTLDYSGNPVHTLPRVVLAPMHYVFLYYCQIKTLGYVRPYTIAVVPKIWVAGDVLVDRGRTRHVYKNIKLKLSRWRDSSEEPDRLKRFLSDGSSKASSFETMLHL